MDDSDALVDLRAVPERAVLIFERNQVARRGGASEFARIVKKHKREKAEIFGFAWHQPAQNACEANRFGAKIGTNERAAFGSYIALVEDEIEDGLYAIETLTEHGKRRYFVRNIGFADFFLRTNKTLRERGLGHEESARDF